MNDRAICSRLRSARALVDALATRRRGVFSDQGYFPGSMRASLLDQKTPAHCLISGTSAGLAQNL
jgi:hypothetical protein